MRGFVPSRRERYMRQPEPFHPGPVGTRSPYEHLSGECPECLQLQVSGCGGRENTNRSFGRQLSQGDGLYRPNGYCFHQASFRYNETLSEISRTYEWPLTQHDASWHSSILGHQCPTIDISKTFETGKLFQWSPHQQRILQTQIPFPLEESLTLIADSTAASVVW